MASKKTLEQMDNIIGQLAEAGEVNGAALIEQLQSVAADCALLAADLMRQSESPSNNALQPG